MIDRTPNGSTKTSGALCAVAVLALLWGALAARGWGQAGAAPDRETASAKRSVPPRVRQAEQFLARRDAAGRRTAGAWRLRAGPDVQGAKAALARSPGAQSSSSPASAASWEPLGPMQVISSNYGLVTGRISSLALDPSDSTGNTLYVGTTGGGVWVSQNAATTNAASVTFTPLTDRPGALSGAEDASVSIGAMTVQPGGTGVVLAGTGDPNDALDSYYGAGLLRSVDGGNTWTLIEGTSDVMDGLGAADHGFLGEGFAGFAWSTANPQLVAAAVSHAYEGALVDADLAGYSYAGLYYSIDSGATWHLARITDGAQDVQGPSDVFAGADGNAATAVVWNPVRNLFLAAVRFHGYYQSEDGVTWTRMAAQPGSGLTTANCPTNTSRTGSTGCPIFRGALAVNPLTGDTFAWSVDEKLQDQGLWQDVCGLNAGACGQSISFGKQWSTALLESQTGQGTATIANGDYNLALAAVPAGPDTLLLAGANDLWKCSLAAGCAWRNTTNAATCMSARVGEYQHAVTWNAANTQEIFAGNDSGLWRSEDAIGETGAACSASDASHWQNLNGGLGSLAEVESLAGEGATPYALLAGLGANGTAGVKSTTGPTMQWPEVLGGEGGPVAIDSTNTNNWYANNGAGVSIHLCAQAGACAAADFGVQPVVTNADTGNDGSALPAPFLVDPADATQLLIATCRLWRGPASGKGWSPANVITPMLGAGSDCRSSPQIRSVAAAALPGGGEVAYVGTFGGLDGGGTLAGHVLSATMDARGTWSGWSDLTLNPVSNDTVAFNAYGLDVSSLTVDPHDSTGKTLYAAIAGIPDRFLNIRMVYRSTDGGAHWTQIMSNLIYAPANALLVDPVDAETVYLATDVGVFVTQKVSTCGNSGANCWAALGNGLPEAPVTALAATQPAGSPNVLIAGTYGRGVWQIPLLTAGQQMTTASVSPGALTFALQAQGTASAAQTVTLTNTGGIALATTLITASGDFSRSETCSGALVHTNQSCTIEVTFLPAASGNRTGQLTIEGNLATGNIVVGLSGTGAAPPAVLLSPALIDFGDVEKGDTSPELQITAANSGGTDVAITSVTVTAPFVLASNACATAVKANADCQLKVKFSPTAPGAATGTLTMVDGAGTQTVRLTGTGTAPPTDSLAPGSLTFPATIVGVPSTAQTVTLTNSGENPLTSISITASGAFQQSNNCTTQLIGPQSCYISVVFLPTAAGPATGQLIVSDILRAQPQTIALQGTGVNPPVFQVTPASLSFIGTPAGTTSAPQTLTVTNAGGSAMANVGFQITGPGAADFAAGAITCGAELDPGTSCTAQVSYTAPASGTGTGNLIVSTSTRGPGNKAITATVPLNGGTGSGGLQALPSLVSFPTTGVGTTSGPVAVTVANLSSSAALDGLALTASAQFQVSSATCGTSLSAGASCTVNLVFAPTAAGPQTGTLTIASSAPVAPATVVLSGAGFDFIASVSGSASQTVSSGETATFALAVAPAGGVAASFAFQCGSLPKYASSRFNPTTLAIVPNATGTETIEIATGTTSASQKQAGWAGVAPITVACVALFLPFALRRRRMLLVLMALVVPIGVTGCSGSGGGGGSTPANPGSHTTPPGTYSISVVVSADGVQHTVALTLVVD